MVSDQGRSQPVEIAPYAALLIAALHYNPSIEAHCPLNSPIGFLFALKCSSPHFPQKACKAFSSELAGSDGQYCTLMPDFSHVYSVANVMNFGMQGKKRFVVECKRCRRRVSAGAKDFPFQSLIVACPLCDEQMRYLPSEVFLGRPDMQIGKQLSAERHSVLKTPTASST
jgi:hypothetical protein